jgi:hypothetical protein
MIARGSGDEAVVAGFPGWVLSSFSSSMKSAESSSWFSFSFEPNAPAHRERPHQDFSGSAESNVAAMRWRAGLGLFGADLRYCFPIRSQYLIHARLPATSLRTKPG